MHPQAKLEAANRIRLAVNKMERGHWGRRAFVRPGFRRVLGVFFVPCLKFCAEGALHRTSPGYATAVIALFPPLCAGGLSSWNDVPYRTFAEVRTLMLTKAADLEDEARTDFYRTHAPATIVVPAEVRELVPA